MQTALDNQFTNKTFILTGNTVACPNLLVVWSDRGTGGATWYPEFVGNNTIVSEIEYTREQQGLIVEVNAVSIHKSCSEISITPYDIFLYVSGNFVPDPTKVMIPNYALQYYVYTNSLSDYFPTVLQQVSGLKQYYSTLQNLLDTLDSYYDHYQAFYTNQAYFLTSTEFSNVWGAKQYKFYKQTTSPNTVGAQGALLNTSDLYVCIGETTTDNLNTQPTTGLLSNDDKNITSDGKNIWELYRQFAETLFVKANPHYTYSGGYLYSTFTLFNPTDGTVTPTTYDYKNGQGDVPKFVRNANRKSKCKIHFKVDDVDTETYEEYVQGMSDSGFEINSLFNIDIPTRFSFGLDTAYRLLVKYANTRGLYYYYSGTMFAVSPCVDFQETIAGGYVTDTATDFETTDITDASQLFTTHVAELREIQSLPNGFRRTAAAVLNLFGRQNNQTKYEMNLPLSTDLCVEMLGNLFQITPDADVSTIETDAYLLESTISWQAQTAQDDYVQCVFLTKSN